jgi:hypothetical protein
LGNFDIILLNLDGPCLFPRLNYFDIISLNLDGPCLFPRLNYFAMLVPNWFEDLDQLRDVLEHHFPQVRSLAGFYDRDCVKIYRQSTRT